jgi:acyl dehydratase
MTLQLGDTAELSKTISARDIEAFALLTGDVNPVHLDEEFAKRTRFGKRIAHGMWGASLISAVLGVKLPGPGTIFLGMDLKFQAPVYVGDTLTARAEIVKIREDKGIVTLRTTCVNQDGAAIMSGEATVLWEAPR